ncbi:MAG: 50S ribosomal protein L7/L12 [Patescibacteria group bacterium]
MASDNVSKIVDAVSGLSVLQLSELVTQLQDKLGVTAMPMAAAAAPAAAGADAGAAAEAAGGGTVLITGSGDNKIAVIKALREINPNLGLQEAKGMTENLPAEVMKDGKTEDAKAAAEKLTAAGATVEVK